eukprot:CAMPEP_0171058740 /NCGR_PEP_ID=MMETSP0766_2-20121228/2698_1 /TAXON_ID=439317 /ORGANISM="Gambierdiscus australes, Strain CAWD 149" /LENGTH=174 /DNA_ID=CAMNT_0011514059 /DNA_START=43 /DNA_END=567 /DNA_ORIENTATION=-
MTEEEEEEEQEDQGNKALPHWALTGTPLMATPPAAASDTTTLIGMTEYYPAPVCAGCKQGMSLSFDETMPSTLTALGVPEAEWKKAIAEINVQVRRRMSTMKWALLGVCIPCIYLVLMHLIQGINLLRQGKVREEVEKIRLMDGRVRFSFSVASNGGNNATHWMWLTITHPPPV